MKNKIFITTFVVILGTLSGINIYLNQKKNKLSSLALANIEALADDENSTPSKSKTVVTEEEETEIENRPDGTTITRIRTCKTTTYSCEYTGILQDSCDSSQSNEYYCSAWEKQED